MGREAEDQARNGLPETSWTMIVHAGGPPGPEKRAALEALYRIYRPAIRALIRSRVHSADLADELTQSFIADQLRRDDLAKVDPARGRFRAWLFTCVWNHVRDHWRATLARPPLSELGPDLEPATGMTPERLYDRHFALALFERALGSLRRRYVELGQEKLFEALKGRLDGDERPHAEIAAELGMAVGTVRVNATRLRDRYHEMLRAEVCHLVDMEGPDAEAEVDEELRHLVASLQDQADRSWA